MSQRVTFRPVDWSQVNGSTESFESGSTVEHCPQCRAARPDMVIVRVRIAAAAVFLRQARLELDELISKLDVELPSGAY